MAGLLPHKGQVLLRSGISNKVWDLLETDKEEFKRQVREYFALGYPHYEVVKYNPEKKIIYLRRKDQ